MIHNEEIAAVQRLNIVSPVICLSTGDQDEQLVENTVAGSTLDMIKT